MDDDEGVNGGWMLRIVSRRDKWFYAFHTNTTAKGTETIPGGFLTQHAYSIFLSDSY